MQCVSYCLEFNLPRHPATNMLLFCCAYTVFLQGICHGDGTSKHCSRTVLQASSSHRSAESASYLPSLCNMFAMVLTCFCQNILQCICNGNAMHLPGLRKAIAMGLPPGSTVCAPLVDRSSCGYSCKSFARFLQRVCHGLEMNVPVIK